MNETRCETCKHWARIADDVGILPDGTPHRVYGLDGSCHRYPPVLHPSETTPDGGTVFTFPVLSLTQWRGEWVSDDPATFDQTAAAMARATLSGDRTAALAMADRIREVS